MFYVFYFTTLLSIQLAYGLEELTGSDGAIYRFEKSKYKLGEGSYGEAITGWKYFEKRTTKVAMKFEKIRAHKTNTVYREREFYELLGRHESIPTYHDFIKDNKGNAVLIIELLGRNLKDNLDDSGEFSIKTTMLIGIQILKVIEHLHNKGVVYSDIKPDNFAVGHDNKSRIYILDFGLCQLYKKNARNSEPESFPPGRGRGKYMSKYAHSHAQLSRRDDIESIAYLLIKFLQDDLPWYYSSLDEMRIMKGNMSIDDIVGNKCTNTLVEFLKYARKLKFEDKPDYKHLRGLLSRELKATGATDLNFEWSIKKPVSKKIQKRK